MAPVDKDGSHAKGGDFGRPLWCQDTHAIDHATDAKALSNRSWYDQGVASSVGKDAQDHIR